MQKNLDVDMPSLFSPHAFASGTGSSAAMTAQGAGETGVQTWHAMSPMVGCGIGIMDDCATRPSKRMNRC